MVSDRLLQALHGPLTDKLKYAGTAWLALSLIANFGRGDLGGFVGLLAILAVITGSEYLLRLFLVFAPLSFLLGVVYIFQHPWSWAWGFLIAVHFLVQGAAIFWAWQQYQGGLGGADSYTVPNGSPGGLRPQLARSDPFQAYVPPHTQQNNNTYQQNAHADSVQSADLTVDREVETKGEGLT